LVNDQLDAQFFSIYLFQFSTRFEQPVLIIRRINCVNTTSGKCHCVSVTVSCAGLRPAHETVTDTQWHIPEVVLTQLILLMMSTGLLETC